MIITKKEFEAITDKVIARTHKKAEEKQNSTYIDINPEDTKTVKKNVNKILQLLYKGVSLQLFEDSEERDVDPEEFMLEVARFTNIAVQIETNLLERSLYKLVCITNSKDVFDEIFGQDGNEWLKKECE